MNNFLKLAVMAIMLTGPLVACTHSDRGNHHCAKQSQCAKGESSQCKKECKKKCCSKKHHGHAHDAMKEGK